MIAQGMVFIVNQASWFWGWGGLWLYPLVIYYLFSLRVRKIKTLVLALFPTLLLHGSYVLVGPGPLGRYYLSTIIAGLSLTVAMVVRLLMQSEESKD